MSRHPFAPRLFAVASLLAVLVTVGLILGGVL